MIQEGRVTTTSRGSWQMGQVSPPFLTLAGCGVIGAQEEIADNRLVI